MPSSATASERTVCVICLACQLASRRKDHGQVSIKTDDSPVTRCESAGLNRWPLPGRYARGELAARGAVARLRYGK